MLRYSKHSGAFFSNLLDRSGTFERAGSLILSAMRKLAVQVKKNRASFWHSYCAA
jgi:hypothetical protein